MQMTLHIRRISLLLRKYDSAREGTRILSQFEAWRQTQQVLPAPHTTQRPLKLLILRLDDIGDYLLFRNQLRTYRASDRWKGHRITLLGNNSWRPIFEAFDSHAVDDVIWVDK